MPDISPAPASTIANCRYCDAFFDTAIERIAGECPASGPQNARVHVPIKSAPAEDRNTFGAQVSRLRDAATASGYWTLLGFIRSYIARSVEPSPRLLLEPCEVSWLASQLEELQRRRDAAYVKLEGSPSRFAFAVFPSGNARTRVASGNQTCEDAEVTRDVLRQLADKTDGAGINGRCTLCGSKRHPGTGWIFDENTETSVPPADCSSPGCLSHKIREVLSHG